MFYFNGFNLNRTQNIKKYHIIITVAVKHGRTLIWVLNCKTIFLRFCNCTCLNDLNTTRNMYEKIANEDLQAKTNAKFYFL